MANLPKIAQASKPAAPEDPMNDASMTTGRMPSASASEVVLNIVEEVLRAGTVTLDDGFYDFGGTSLQAMRICVRIEKTLAVVIKPEVLLDSDCLGDFARSVAELKDA
ncbi:acyl carrier protein [Streptomyces cyaneochromogenes]|uniref:Acyl carrier protein n=1 Tax=Streptomyces cyaneochromogenes TaxID=2496836 RepID=A0A3Q9EN77_9ACTN|nr:acyl carrier protein [Streptomyces cyaneochromogenes]AZQ32133.1 acyl carrier protein [Streptomyces cyaneochromogenes]AZQ40090.1 acyl carrier protein [Streptomyces cyaneochromogenes]